MAERKQNKAKNLADGENPENTGFRIWPGVTVITVCASLVFIIVYVVAYRVHLIPLPGILQSLLSKGSEKQVVVENVAEEGYMPSQETFSATYYAPEESDPFSVLVAMQVPEIYHQHMRITIGDAEKKTVDLYRQGGSWKLIVEDEGGVWLYLWNGDVFYRQNPLYPDGITTTLGTFTPENLLGLPDLAILQSLESASVEIVTADKVLRVRYSTDAELEWVCKVSLDAALVTEAQLLRDGQVVMAMYTEYFDLAPEAWDDTIVNAD